MAHTLLLLALSLLSLAAAQTLGTSPEEHPKLQTWKCTIAGGCVEKMTAVVMDASAHPVHQLDNPALDCGEWGSAPNVTVCPDVETCAKNCIIEGISVSDYAKAGVTTNSSSLTMEMLGPDGSYLSPRVYLLAEGEKKYEMLKLLDGEIAFDVDLAKLPCGMNGALYMTEMDERGGQSELNQAGAAYGTGYCDAQCFTTPFINGVGNIEGKGGCCSEMDLLEANVAAVAVTPHVCNHTGNTGLYECTGAECAWGGVCDQWGCSQNPYALGNKDFYGPGLTVDTSEPFTVVTSFVADQGKLTEIHRKYIQGANVITNAVINVTGYPAINFNNEDYCIASNASRFNDLGGMEVFGEALERGMVLIFSIWWDTTGFMNWLDSGNTGPCNPDEGNPTVIKEIQQNPVVIFSNIKWGEIGSTY